MSEIKTSLPSIIQFISTPGARRGRVPVQLRAMYEDPTRHPWRYYDPIVTAVVNGLRGDRLRTELDLAVARSEEREESDRRCGGSRCTTRRSGPACSVSAEGSGRCGSSVPRRVFGSIVTCGSTSPRT